MADSLVRQLNRDAGAEDLERDLREALPVIAERSRSLARFMSSYSQLTRLPPPKLEDVSVSAWIRRVAALETRLHVTLAPGPEVVVRADGDQLDQLLINLVANAADAALETGGGVSITWTVRQNPATLLVIVDDDGPGIANPSNLFVPFFTTKPKGSGIGLVLSRQVAEAHGGTVTLSNRPDRRGGRAIVRLPLPA
jgi:signal transduction histidine kinase